MHVNAQNLVYQPWYGKSYFFLNDLNKLAICFIQISKTHVTSFDVFDIEDQGEKKLIYKCLFIQEKAKLI